MTAAELTMSKRWYIVHTYSGFEGKVRESLRQRADAMGMSDVTTFGIPGVCTGPLANLQA